MIKHIVSILWGNRQDREITKFGFLALIGFFLIAAYWLLKPLKDGIFIKMVGAAYLPYVKTASCLFIIPVMLCYSKLIDTLPKQRLFCLLAWLYAACFFGFFLLLQHPVFGIANTSVSVARLEGWFFYVIVESFSSLMVALFWAYVASITTTTSAKSNFSLIILGGQVGALLGPIFSLWQGVFTVNVLFLCSIVSIAFIPCCMYFFVRRFPEVTERAPKPINRTGMLEGLRLLCREPYLLGVFGIVAFREIVVAMLELHQLSLASEQYHSLGQLTQFIGHVGLAINSLSLLFALLGTSFFLRTLGVRLCLILFPALLACIGACIPIFSSLSVLVVAFVAAKGLGYALYDPCKEIMYIPTSRDVKFKAKGWIDMFGYRASRAIGATMGTMLNGLGNMFVAGSGATVTVCSLWLVVALLVGRHNHYLIATNKIIE